MFGNYNGAQTASGAARHGVSLELGELIMYDPSTHMGTFQLAIHKSNLNGPSEQGEPIDTGPIPIGTLYTGPGYGMRFVPYVAQTGSQALILFTDEDNEHPLCAIFFFNELETPPFSDTITNGWKDKAGNLVTTDDNGLALLSGTQNVAAIAPHVGLGDLFTNLGPDDAVVTVGQLRKLTAIFNMHSHSGVAGGNAVSGPAIQKQTPQGSATVRATA